MDKYLLNHDSAPSNVCILQGRTPLHLAIGRCVGVRYWLRRRMLTGRKTTLLELDKSVLEMLFERGLNVNAVDKQV